MAGRLLNKVAIVTGGGSGIGEAICKRFAREGAAVVVVGLNSDPVRDVVEEILASGGRAIGYLGDISRQDTAKSCVKAAVDEFGWLDILINNAGVFPATAELDKYPVDALEYMIKNNIYPVFMRTRSALPALQKSKGTIVSAGFEAGHMGSLMITPYGATKAWVMTFSKGLAVEQAKHGVRVNCVGPGPIDTAWTHKETGPMNAKMEKNTVDGVPLGRRGTPEEVANVYLFLASDEASYVTGATYFVDGGVTISTSLPGEDVPSHLKQQPPQHLKLAHRKAGNAKVREDATASMS
ncbi:SDR family NAD(P)-dependent oxidoreductase [Hymenobacter psychrophilus]|uniref:NAD(P)-dependent dehydrogenase, short-chain alcohol dehydrogenase family n=1 Tax=Hymenobacter psychrophilus TaxID=651662 RepID=A0A1H3KQ32_9BACT|nr:SDR family oxidoreductase [Hymenobacter psychrophilus]SDY53815.1 NAD(P)-dependent dehydrogenase, short-chain alcohol dehydrogenase family [Hymenobacter psychrophilus]